MSRQKRHTRPVQLKRTDFRLLFEGSPAAIAISRLEDGVFVEANAAFLQLHGITREELIGHTSAELQLWHKPEARSKVLGLIKAQGHAHHFLHEYRHKSGRIGRATVSLDIIELEGKPHVIGFLNDLSALDEAQTALAESEMRLSAALKITQLVVFHQNRDLRYEWIANPALGLSAENTIGRSDEELLGNAEAAPLAKIKRRVMRNGRGERQEVWLTRAGQRGCFDLIVEPRRDARGNVTGVICAAADITQRKLAEEQLKLQANILENLEEGVNLIDAASIIRYTNPKFDAMFGYATGELLGCHASILNAPDAPASPEEIARNIQQALNRTGHWRGDLKNRRKDGTEFWTHANIVAVQHPKLGKVWVSVQDDITAMRQLQMERDAAYRSLEHLTDHIQDEIEGQRQELSREVHDEIGALLTGIRMQLDAVMRAQGASERRNLDELAHIRSLIDQTTARTRNLCTRLRPPVLDDLGLVEACRWYLRDWSRLTGIHARGRMSKPGSEPPDNVRIDLFRILQELLTNIARHAGASLVTVTLTAGHTGLRLRVCDNGHGFVPGKPTGGGLAGIRERLRRHGGAMAIESSATGTRVSVRIPDISP